LVSWRLFLIVTNWPRLPPGRTISPLGASVAVSQIVIVSVRSPRVRRE
jgi:hypothetical protein